MADTARQTRSRPEPVERIEIEYRGYFDRFEDGHASGWITETDAIGRAVTLDVLVDGTVVDTITADEVRDDVRAILQLVDDRVGFSWDVPLNFLDGTPHHLAFRLPTGRFVSYIGPGGITDLYDGHEFSARPLEVVHGHVDGYERGSIRGWVLRRVGRRDAGSGGCHLVVHCNGVRAGQIKADRYRPDVARALGCAPNCGFEFALPARFRKPYPQAYRFTVIPDGIELDNSPFTTTGVDDHLEAKLAGVVERVNRVHRELLRELTELRRDVTDLLPTAPWTIEDYDPWARRYYDGLRARVATARAASTREGHGPLVSVLLPTYRPQPSDFIAAVESVIAQTWPNWELVIVDDGGKSPAITALIDEFARRDSRIRPIKRKRNVGIARATNVALEAAVGDWIAFFDHDDVLVDVALEVMVREAEASGARMLFSDEDKIDPVGYFLEPNLKPAWNHRFMLGCNYVCHLLMVAADTARAVGPLRSEYDGAQDHDYILRVAETVGDAAIRHVPEILYHWRKTPGSTAADISNKQYAVEAGVRAVGDHLARIGRAATVRSIDNLTIYQVEFEPLATPPITVVIPFKDELELTRRCVEALRRDTDYPALDIVLVDNWSVSPGAHAFRDEMGALEGVRVLLVEEDFNYARLNNLAIASSDAPFVLVINNDVLMSGAGWLRRMLGEMSDPTVGAVGAKLLYPNGAVQHAGVLAGVHGVAAHMHAGLGGHEYGYIGRARLSQELTAVTAACMLLRRSAFDAVGGFDEERLAVAYNDVDLCLKLRVAGWRVILNAEAVGEHHESASRGSDLRPEQEERFFVEQQAMLERWRDHVLFRRDPAYNRWFSREDRPFFDLVDPRGPDA